ncbi:MAG: hypothetical protein KJ579_03015 [Verrucomicrobia bacterium]|nr:hypothetical protein [Verrucomicrobiota bacterium]
MNPTLLTNSFTLPEDGWYQLAPEGEFPHKATGLVQVLDPDACRAIAADFAKASAMPNFGGVLVDYDHFSLDRDKPSEAAGWILNVEHRPGLGLWGRIRWTDTGEAAIRGGRYRYISPVWRQDECDALDGGKVRPRRLTNAAVTNSPNLFGMLPLSNSARPPPSSSSASSFAPLRLCVPPPSGFQVSGFRLHPSLLANALQPGNARQRRAVMAKFHGASSAAPRSSASDRPLSLAEYDAKVADDARAAAAQRQDRLASARQTAARAAVAADRQRVAATADAGSAEARRIAAGVGVARPAGPRQSAAPETAATPAPARAMSMHAPVHEYDASADLGPSLVPRDNRNSMPGAMTAFGRLGGGPTTFAAEASAAMRQYQATGVYTRPQAQANAMPGRTSATSTMASLGGTPTTAASARSDGRPQRIADYINAWLPGITRLTSQGNTLGRAAQIQGGRRQGETPAQWIERTRRMYNRAPMTDDQRKAMFAKERYGAAPAPDPLIDHSATTRDHAARIDLLQKERARIADAAPVRPEPRSFDTVDTRALRDDLLRQGRTLNEITAAVRDAEAQNAAVRGATDAILADLKARGVPMSQRDTALAAEIEKIRKADAKALADYDKAMARHSGKLAALDRDIEEERIRAAETEARTAQLAGNAAVREALAADKARAAAEAAAARKAETEAARAAAAAARIKPVDPVAENRLIKARNRAYAEAIVRGDLDLADRLAPGVDHRANAAAVARLMPSQAELNSPRNQKVMADVIRSLEGTNPHAYPRR